MMVDLYILLWLVVVIIIVLCAAITEPERDEYRQVAPKQRERLRLHTKGDRSATGLQTSRRGK